LFADGTSSRHDGSMRRYLRLTAAAGLMLAAAGLLALWQRSYGHSDSARVSVSRRSLRANSCEGSLHFVVGQRMTWIGPQPEPWWSWDARSLEIKPTSEPPAANKANPLLLLQLRHARDISYLNVPHWLVAALLGAAGAALWRGSRRFTLRTMLGVTALVAVLLGLAARE
jgi:hypothetical protein